ncbi:MAG: TetR/AcrR family transcriptional regulator [Alphaproteobacteria bacterium]
MTKRQTQREQAIEALSAHLLSTGLSQTSVRQLAGAAGISDRMLLYYFDDKTDIMTAVLQHIAADMAAKLGLVLPGTDPVSSGELFTKAAAATGSKAMRPYMQLWIEIAARAGQDEEPFNTISSMIADGFLAWIESRLDLKDDAERKTQAAMILTMVDGLALLRTFADETVVARAAQGFHDALEG